MEEIWVHFEHGGDWSFSVNVVHDDVDSFEVVDRFPCVKESELVELVNKWRPWVSKGHTC